MADQMLNAAVAGLLDGANRLARVANQTLPEALAKPFDAETSARLSLAQQLAHDGSLNTSDSAVNWPYLQPVFNQIHEFKGSGFLRPKRLALDADTLLPIGFDVVPAEQFANADCAAMGTDFASALREAAAVSDPRWQVERLLNTMQEFGWAVAAGPDRPDVSLFNQTRITAALAAALAADGRSVDWCDKAKGDAEICALVLGDVNGVQEFIYSLASRGAAKTLRGRSFYVQLLTEVVAEYILDKLQLPLTNLLYAGGGNFYLVIGAEQSKQLAAIRTDVTQRLNSAHEGAINVTLGETVVKASEFATGQFAEAWTRLHSEVGQRKRQPFEALSAADMLKLTGAELGIGGDENDTCSVCGSEKQPGEEFEPDEFGGDIVQKCEFCRSLELLGNDLSKATHLIWLKLPVPEKPARNIRNWRDGLRNLGTQFVAVNAEEPNESYLRLKEPGPVLARIALVGDTQRARYADQLRQELDGVPTLHISRLFAQLVARDKDGMPLTFDEIGERTQLKRWAVLRMDVDDLGALFRRGFIIDGQNRLTLARVAGLSFALRLFFEGWLPKLADGDPDFKDVLYLQYAGGDDVFLVGTWNALPKFALRIRDSLQRYVGNNPKVTVSAGISLADLRYPLYQAADDAETAEKAAKNDPKKNAVTFLSQTLGWDDFANAAWWADQLTEWAKDNQIRKALIQTLLEIGASYRTDQERGKPRFGRWMWMLAYHITRAAQRSKTQPVKRGLADIEQLMLTPQGIHTMTLAARWAELASRENNGHQR